MVCYKSAIPAEKISSLDNLTDFTETYYQGLDFSFVTLLVKCLLQFRSHFYSFGHCFSYNNSVIEIWESPTNTVRWVKSVCKL